MLVGYGFRKSGEEQDLSLHHKMFPTCPLKSSTANNL